jgi:hypothetical protein
MSRRDCFLTGSRALKDSADTVPRNYAATRKHPVILLQTVHSFSSKEIE